MNLVLKGGLGEVKLATLENKYWILPRVIESYNP